MAKVNVSRLARLAILSLAVSLIGSGVTSRAGENDTGETSIYVLVPEQSQIAQTGGIAGVDWSYALEGRFQMSIDLEAGSVRFDTFDTLGTASDRPDHVLDPNSVFNATGLSGVVIDANTVEFGGFAPDGSDVLITLALEADSAHLTGRTVPPAGSADFFVFTLDAVARRKYGGGTGEPNTPYLIATADHLNAIGTEPNDWNQHFRLTADIDLSGLDGKDGRPAFNIIAPDTNGVEQLFQGIPFAGVFDGDGHKLSHLTVAGNDCLGLFGELAVGGELKNLGVVDVNIVGTGDYIGGLVGRNWGGSVTQCCCTGAVRGKRTVGGLAGINFSGIVSNSYSMGVVGNDTSDCIGGLVGTNLGDLVNCYSGCGIASDANYVGGLAGSEHGSVCRMNECWEINGAATECFWDIETSGQAESAGGLGKTTAEMQRAQTFLEAGWDFVGETENGIEDIWWILDGQDYPRLRWERVLDDDFEDGQAEPLWWVSEPYPEHMWVQETDGRLEFQATAEIDDSHAAYVGNGWRLDATSDFALRVDFHFAKRTAGDCWVFVALLPSLEPGDDEPVGRNIDFEAGCMNDQPFYLYEIIDDALGREESQSRWIDDGTLYVSYNAGGDELYLSDTGYGKANAWKTITGLLGTQWQAGPLYVALGGGSDHVALDAGEAYLDNFVINAGVLLPAEQSDD